MAEEFEALKNQVKELKAWKESHQEIQDRSSFSSPISIAASKFSPQAIVLSTPLSDRSGQDRKSELEERWKTGKLNNAAMAIMHQTMAARDWQASDIDDCPNILDRISSDTHYLNHCKRKKGDPIPCADGSTCETVLLLFRLNSPIHLNSLFILSFYLTENFWSSKIRSRLHRAKICSVC
jgi:hypothetical protein